MPDSHSSFEQRLDRMESDIADMRTDIKTLLAAYNAGRGVGFTMKMGAAIVAMGAAIATFWHYVFGATQ